MKAGRELDALIAEKVMGYYIDNRPEVCVYLWITDPSKRYLPIAQRWAETIEPIPYSTDIAAAWKVIEQLEWPYFELSFDSITWSFKISDGEKIIWGTSDLDNPSPMLAICRGALESKGVNVT